MSTRGCVSFGTAKNAKITANTNRLSIERLHSIRYPAMYSPAAVPPWVAARIPV